VIDILWPGLRARHAQSKWPHLLEPVLRDMRAKAAAILTRAPSEKMPTWFRGGEEAWARMSPVERWRFLNRSTICTQLALASVSYLNANPRLRRKNCQRILARIRATRPPLG
jgi:hypothetical protein